MALHRRHSGIDNDVHAATTGIRRRFRDTWLVGIIPESGTCAGRDHGRWGHLYNQAYNARQPFGRLPPELHEGDARVRTAALERACQADWNVELDDH